MEAVVSIKNITPDEFDTLRDALKMAEAMHIMHTNDKTVPLKTRSENRIKANRIKKLSQQFEDQGKKKGVY